MNAVYLIILGCMALLGGSAIFALLWASKTGQFSDMQRGAEVIFDKDEPVGQPTDTILKSRNWFRRQQTPAVMEKI